MNKLLVFLGFSLSLGVGSVYGADESNWISREANKDQHWIAYVGGEWDFLTDEGTPLNGEDWQEVHYGLGYVDKSLFSVTFDHRIPGRTDQFDHVFGLDGHLKIARSVWFHGAFHASPDHDFVYRSRTDAELEWYIRNFSIGAGYWYIDFSPNNVHVPSVFFRLFWRNFMFDARYLRIMEVDDDKNSNAGSFRITHDFQNRWFQPHVGFVVGERLFGILTLQQAPEQSGYIVFGGNTFGLTPRLDLTTTISYADEDPAFRYLGLGADLKLKF